MRKIDFVLLTSCFAMAGLAHAGTSSRPARACDTYIQEYCADSDVKGPGCLKGHESDVDAACLADIERKGPPPGGRNPNGNSSSSSSSSSSQD